MRTALEADVNNRCKMKDDRIMSRIDGDAVARKEWHGALEDYPSMSLTHPLLRGTCSLGWLMVSWGMNVDGRGRTHAGQGYRVNRLIIQDSWSSAIVRHHQAVWKETPTSLAGTPGTPGYSSDGPTA